MRWMSIELLGEFKYMFITMLADISNDLVYSLYELRIIDSFKCQKLSKCLFKILILSR